MAKKLKDWFDRECARRLGTAINNNHHSFDVQDYVDAVDAGLGGLELKDRVYLMASALFDRLPDDYHEISSILSASLGPPLDGETGMFTKGYWLMPIARLVEEFGQDHIDLSLTLCAEITRRHTAEYAVRPYLRAEPEKAMRYVRSWVHSADPHIRRLASEGIRPRLPWAKRLELFIEHPEAALDAVAPLRTDRSRYVQTSVANLINDISKDHPDLIRALALDWSKERHDVTDWIVRHGTRTLRKSDEVRSRSSNTVV